MKIYSKVGSKERMLEMMMGVNKIKLNEFQDSFNGTNLGSNFNEEPPAEQPKQYSGKFQDLEIDEDAMKTIDSLPSEEPEESKPESDDFDMSGENTQEPEQSAGDTLQGGLGDNVSNTEFNGEQIRKGLKVEMEHTDDPMVALDIVYDHLTEDPMYYGDENQDPEQSAQCGAQSDVPTHGQDQNISRNVGMMNNGEDDNETDILLGFKPINVGDEIKNKSSEIDEYFGEKAVSGIRKVMTGHGDSGEAQGAQAKIIADIDDLISKFVNYPTVVAYDGGTPEQTKANLLQQAQENNWRGTITPVKSYADGKMHIIYKPGATGFQNMVGAASAGTEKLGGF
jgi:hypothetical protein